MVKRESVKLIKKEKSCFPHLKEIQHVSESLKLQANHPLPQKSAPASTVTHVKIEMSVSNLKLKNLLIVEINPTIHVSVERFFFFERHYRSL